MGSILDEIKDSLDISDEYTAFDNTLIMHINAVFSTLSQLGIGPNEGFEISDNTATWEDFLAGDPRYNSVKTYVYMKVRLAFDPPSTSFAITSLENQAREIEWRLNEQHLFTTGSETPNPESEGG